MPKTIAITPSWYWPANVTRVTGVPPFHVDEQLVERWARHRPDETALIDATERLSGRELLERVQAAAAALRQQADASGGEGARAVLAAGPTAEGAVLLLALLRAGIPTRLVSPDGGDEPGSFGATMACGDDRGAASLASTGLPVIRLSGLTGAASGPCPRATSDRALAVSSNGDTVWHSHRSIVGGALSLQTFLGLGPQRPWLSTHAISTWQGVYGLTVPLAAGATVVLAPPDEGALDTIAREGVGGSFWALDAAFAATREAKRQVKSIRGVQEFILLSTPKLFDPDERRRVGKLFDSPALTLFGLPETGPIFASHPSWYLDESIGIPISNACVVPVDPRSGNPIPTLWELVESAMVTVWSPGLFEGYEGDAHPERRRDGRFVTGVIASSDANGMIYLLPD